MDVSIPQPKYDTAFQRGLLRLCLEDPFFAAQCVGYLKDDVDFKKLIIFNTKPLAIIFDAISESVQKYDTNPSVAQVKHFFGGFAPEEQDELCKTLERVLVEDVHDTKFYFDEIGRFVKQVKMGIAAIKIRDSWQNNRLETADVMQAQLDSINRVSFEADTVLTLDDIDSIADDAAAMLDGLIPTGIPKLDADLLGGLPRETLVCVLGGTNSGKSMFCIGLAANALRNGRNVVHIALEGTKNEALLRYTANLSGVPVRAIMQRNMSASQKAQLSQAKEYAKNLRIVNMLDFNVQVEVLMAKVSEMYKAQKIDMLVVDYSQLLSSASQQEGARHVQTHVHRALAALSRKLNCVVVTPIQANRGSQKEQADYVAKRQTDSAPILRSDDISEDINIARIAGVILTLNRTDQEDKESKLRVYLEKQRMEQKNKIYGLITNYGLSRLITGNFYDPYSVTDTVSMDVDNDKVNTNMAAMIQRREREDQEKLLRKIVNLIGEKMTINGGIQEQYAIAESKELTNEEGEALRLWVDEENARRDVVVKQIREAVSSYYPNANLEVYKLTKASVDDMEKSGEANPEKLKEQKQILKHWAYLYESGKA